VQWDLGFQGLATLAGLAIALGVVAQLLFWSRATWWVGPVAAIAYLVIGIVVSEVMFGWATEVELQPNIDGLSFDEALAAWVVSLAAVVAIRYLARGRVQQLTRR
jgi:hypothetical protein